MYVEGNFTDQYVEDDFTDLYVKKVTLQISM